MGNVRVLPLLVFAGLCLLGLKAMGLLLSGSYVLSGTAPASAQQQTEKGQPAEQKAEPETNTAPADKEKEKTEKSAQKQKDEAAGSEKKSDKTAAKGKPGTKDNAPLEDERLKGGPNGGTSNSELAVLEGLANRRKHLDKRVRELELRENLLMAAEKRVEVRITELKSIESRIESELKRRDNVRNEQYGRLVKMYSGMKPKDAARIFDRLDINALTDLVARMKPRIMSTILASMAPAAAERLTLEIALRGRPATQAAAILPKIPSQRTN